MWRWLAMDIVRIRGEAPRAHLSPDDFDSTYGVRTRVVPTLRELIRTTRRGGFEHEPSPPDLFRAVLDGLDIDFKETVFVDYGSGAARAVLLAAEYPFKEVVGVEIAPSLHAHAEANRSAFPAAACRAHGVRLVCGDAAAFALPPQPLVLYFYNPFGVAVMRRVLANIEASLAERPRPIILVVAQCYREPREILLQSRAFRIAGTTDGIVTLRSC
jgi:SAM-dependent methyltransferase